METVKHVSFVLMPKIVETSFLILKHPAVYLTFYFLLLIYDTFYFLLLIYD